MLFIFLVVWHIYTIKLLGDNRWVHSAEYYIKRPWRSQITLLMMALYFLQCIWFLMILKLLYKELRTKEFITDSRSDDENESDDNLFDETRCNNHMKNRSNLVKNGELRNRHKSSDSGRA